MPRRLEFRRHLRTDAEGRPLAFELTGGEAHEVKGYHALMELCEERPEKLLGDKGYDTDTIRDDLEERGIEAPDGCSTPGPAERRT